SLFNFLNFPEVSASLGGARATPSGRGSAVAQSTAAVHAERPYQPSALHPAAAAPRLGLSLSWLLGLWSAGASALAIYLGFTHYRLSRRVAVRRPFIDAPVMNLLEDCKQQMGVRVPVTLVETGEVGSPALFGFVRPRLLLPAGLTRKIGRASCRERV